MSKFFRSSTSSGSSSSDSSSDNDDAEELQPGPTQTSLLNRREIGENFLGAFQPNILSSVGGPSFHRDLLLHALLEERCANEVISEREASGNWRNSGKRREIERETQARYQQLCARLAPLNLVSTGLDEDQHAPARRRYREGLDVLSRHPLPTGSRRRGVPAALERLLTDSPATTAGDQWQSEDEAQRSGSAASALGDVEPLHRLLMPSQYLRDFEELGVLGKGGYGTVFQVRHRLDGLTYAVKKVPIRPSVVARMQSHEGRVAMEDMLVELRTLAKLDHPNVVRYFNSWIEWSTDTGVTSNSQDSNVNRSNGNASVVFSAEEAKSNGSKSFRRVFTESDGVSNIGLSFQSHSHQAAAVSASSADLQDWSALSRSRTDGALWSTSGPTLALHMQMAMYPMTLAEFLLPGNTGSVAPLAHCFHLEPSIHILLAILNGVEYLHSENIVHRDLKPANIFLRLEKNPRSTRGCVDLFLCPACRAENNAYPATMGVRIGDFGLVTRIAQSDDVPPTPPLNPAVGTEMYRPSASKSNVSPALDIFALGIIAFELLWKFDTQMERRDTLQRLKQGQFPSRFPSFEANRGDAVRDCISAMLSQKLTISDVKHRLSSVIEAM